MKKYTITNLQALYVTNDSHVDINYINDSQNCRLQIIKAATFNLRTTLGIQFYKNYGFSGKLPEEH